MAATTNAHADAFPLLEARHVDSLIEATRALNRSVTMLVEAGRKQLEATRAQTVAIRELAELLRGNVPGATPPASHSSPSLVVPIKRAARASGATERRKRTRRSV